MQPLARPRNAIEERTPRARAGGPRATRHHALQPARQNARRLAWAAVLTFAAACAQPSAPRPVRLVLVSLDTLRQSAFLGAEGLAGAMPELTAWSEGAAVFRRCYATSSTTQPTHATLLTGLQPWQHGVSRNGVVLADSFTTLAERLADKGCRTAAVVASFPLHRSFGWSQGFDAYFDTFRAGSVGEWNSAGPVDGAFYNRATEVIDTALAWLDAAGTGDQFLWVHLFDAHAPYGDWQDPDSTFDVPSIALRIAAGEAADEVCAEAHRAYRADVGHLDRELARLLRRLDADRGWTTHVVVTADHGESFGEEGALGHGKRLTPEQLLVPLLVRSPDVIPGVRDVPVGTLDVATTLMALGGLAERPPSGRDLRADVPEAVVYGMRRVFTEATAEPRADGHEVVIPASSRRFYAVEDGTCYTGGSRAITIDDAGAAIEDEARAERLRATFQTFASELAAIQAEAPTDSATLDALRRLGYADGPTSK